MTNYITSVGVQHFSVTIGTGKTTGTVTINAVGANALIIYDGFNPTTTNNPAIGFARITLTNSTTITATRNTSDATNTISITGCIIDATSNLITSIQFGTVSIANTASSGTASISAVTNTNAATQLLGWSSDNTTYSGVNEQPVISLSGTTVTATRTGTGGNLTVGFCIIEFTGAALNQSVQNVSATSSASVTSYTATITSVVTTNSILIYAGSNIATSTTNMSQILQSGSLTNGTTVTISVSSAVANAKTYNCTVVEFISGLLNSSVQRGTTAITAGNGSNTSTITSVVKNNSLLSYLGFTTNNTTARIDLSAESVLTNNTTVTISRFATTGATTTGSWEVAEFKAAVSFNDSLTETVTSSDSVTGTSNDKASLTESSSATDSYLSSIIGIFSISESLSTSDSYSGGKITSDSLTESSSATDLINGSITINGSMTEIILSSDNFSGVSSINVSLTELSSANDNYVDSGSQPVNIAIQPQTGSGDDRRKKYLKWLEKNKNRRNKKYNKPKIPEKFNIPSFPNLPILEEKEDKIIELPIFNEKLARDIAERVILKAKEDESLRIEEDEDEIFIMMG